MKPELEHTTLNILLADDDTDDRFFFEQALKEIPIANHLTSVHDGDQLMNNLFANSEHLPDVLFLDLSMPRKTGFECLSEIKEHKILKDLHVVMFSTSFPRDLDYERDMIKMLYEIGAQDYIRKPSDFTELKQVIQKALIKAIEKESNKK
jgi:CheY-like chemotaxis protein